MAAFRPTSLTRAARTVFAIAAIAPLISGDDRSSGESSSDLGSGFGSDLGSGFGGDLGSGTEAPELPPLPPPPFPSPPSSPTTLTLPPLSSPDTTGPLLILFGAFAIGAAYIGIKTYRRARLREDKQPVWTTCLDVLSEELSGLCPCPSAAQCTECREYAGRIGLVLLAVAFVSGCIFLANGLNFDEMNAMGCDRCFADPPRVPACPHGQDACLMLTNGSLSICDDELQNGRRASTSCTGPRPSGTRCVESRGGGGGGRQMHGGGGGYCIAWAPTICSYCRHVRDRKHTYRLWGGLIVGIIGSPFWCLLLLWGIIFVDMASTALFGTGPLRALRPCVQYLCGASDDDELDAERPSRTHSPSTDRRTGSRTRDDDTHHQEDASSRSTDDEAAREAALSSRNLTQAMERAMRRSQLAANRADPRPMLRQRSRSRERGLTVTTVDATPVSVDATPVSVGSVDTTPAPVPVVTVDGAAVGSTHGDPSLQSVVVVEAVPVSGV